jgi:hypothetical protein
MSLLVNTRVEMQVEHIQRAKDRRRSGVNGFLGFLP